MAFLSDTQNGKGRTALRKGWDCRVPRAEGAMSALLGSGGAGLGSDPALLIPYWPPLSQERLSEEDRKETGARASIFCISFSILECGLSSQYFKEISESAL